MPITPLFSHLGSLLGWVGLGCMGRTREHDHRSGWRLAASVEPETKAPSARARSILIEHSAPQPRARTDPMRRAPILGLGPQSASLLWSPSRLDRRTHRERAAARRRAPRRRGLHPMIRRSRTGPRALHERAKKTRSRDHRGRPLGPWIRSIRGGSHPTTAQRARHPHRPSSVVAVVSASHDGVVGYPLTGPSSSSERPHAGCFRSLLRSRKASRHEQAAAQEADQQARAI